MCSLCLSSSFFAPLFLYSLLLFLCLCLFSLFASVYLFVCHVVFVRMMSTSLTFPSSLCKSCVIFVSVFVYSVSLFSALMVCLFVVLLVCLFIYLFICLSICRFVCLSVWFLCEWCLPAWNSHQACVSHKLFWFYLCLFYDDVFPFSLLSWSVCLSFCLCGICVNDVYQPGISSLGTWCVVSVFVGLSVCLSVCLCAFCMNNVYQPGIPVKPVWVTSCFDFIFVSSMTMSFPFLCSHGLSVCLSVCVVFV